MISLVRYVRSTRGTIYGQTLVWDHVALEAAFVTPLLRLYSS
jgi:hypothetical protein